MPSIVHVYGVCSSLSKHGVLQVAVESLTLYLGSLLTGAQSNPTTPVGKMGRKRRFNAPSDELDDPLSFRYCGVIFFYCSYDPFFSKVISPTLPQLASASQNTFSGQDINACDPTVHPTLFDPQTEKDVHDDNTLAGDSAPDQGPPDTPTMPKEKKGKRRAI